MTFGYPELLLAFGIGFFCGGALVNRLWTSWAKRRYPSKEIAR